MSIITFACKLNSQWKKAFEVSMKKREELERAKRMLARDNLSHAAERGLRETVKMLETDLAELRTRVAIIEGRYSKETGEMLQNTLPSFRCPVCDGIIYGEKEALMYIHWDCLGRLK